MCCKAGGHNRSSSHREDLKVKAFWNARKKSCLPQGKRKGKRGFRNSEVKSGVNGLISNGSKKILSVPDCRESSSLFCSPSNSGIGGIDAGVRVTTPVKNFSPTSVEIENLAAEADMESLPLDVLVRIVCNVHHDELEPLFHVSSKFREAASIAREMHFDYITPVRVRASRKRASCLIPDEISQNCTSFEGSDCFLSSSRLPATPNAPKQLGKFQKSKMTSDDMKDVATFLFPPATPGNESETRFVNKSRFLRSGAAPNRVLFVEDDLCEAVEDELCL